MTAELVTIADAPCEAVAYFRDEAAAQLGADAPAWAVAMHGEVLRLHARVDEIETLAESFAELGSKGLGGMLSGLFGTSS